jgi:hypothetical protein
MVHYVAGRKCVAGIVTAVGRTVSGEETITLHVFPPDVTDGSAVNVGYDEENRTEGSWHWPERV